MIAPHLVGTSEATGSVPEAAFARNLPPKPLGRDCLQPEIERLQETETAGQATPHET